MFLDPVYRLVTISSPRCWTKLYLHNRYVTHWNELKKYTGWKKRATGGDNGAGGVDDDASDWSIVSLFHGLHNVTSDTTDDAQVAVL